MAKTQLNDIDRKILRFLIKNARMPYLEIARECGISGAAIHQRIRKLEELNVIQGSRILVNPKALGFDVCAFIGITLKDPQLLLETMDKLMSIPEIVESHFVTGDYNILVKIYCTDNEHMMHTLFDNLLSIPGVASTQTSLSLKESFQRQIYLSFLGEED
ncbi:MAG: Lrp/AsnC ligand binding domain-containing protein [Rikenellaceae bacterium]